MKIKITFKDPDALHECIEEAYEDLSIGGLEKEEIEVIKQDRIEKAGKLAGRWFKWSEYLTVEIDTELKTCIVLPIED